MLSEPVEYAAPGLRRLARASKRELAAYGLREEDRFDLNRLAWMLPEIVRMDANPMKRSAVPGKPRFPTPSDMNLSRRVCRFLNPEG